MSAAQRGTREVGLAVVSTTLAVCAVFVSIAFMRSVIGRYFYEFGVAVTAAVCVSTLVAFTLTPMLASRMLRPSGEPGWLFRLFARALRALDGGYRWLLVRSLRHKLVTLAVGAAAVLGGCGVASTLPFDLYSQEDLNEVLVQAKFPIGTPLSVTDRLLRRMEAEVIGHPDVRDVIAAAGDETRHEPHRARIELMLIPKERARTPYTRDLPRAAHPAARCRPRGRGDHGGTPDLRGYRGYLHGPQLQPAGSGPRPAGALRQPVDGADARGPRLRRRGHLLRSRQAPDHARRRPRPRGGPRRLGGGDRAHDSHPAGRREGGIVRGGRSPPRRAGPGPARVPRRPGQDRPDPGALASRGARPHHQRRLGEAGGGTGRDPAGEPHPRDRDQCQHGERHPAQRRHRQVRGVGRGAGDPAAGRDRGGRPGAHHGRAGRRTSASPSVSVCWPST